MEFISYQLHVKHYLSLIKKLWLFVLTDWVLSLIYIYQNIIGYLLKLFYTKFKSYFLKNTLIQAYSVGCPLRLLNFWMLNFELKEIQIAGGKIL